MKIYYPKFNIKTKPNSKPEHSPDEFSEAARILKIWSKADATERGKKYMRDNGMEIEGNEMLLIQYDTVTKKTNVIDRFVVDSRGITRQ